MPGCAGTTRGEAASGRRSCSRACCHCCAEESVDILDESVGVPTRHRSCWSESSIGDSRLVVRSSRKEASVYFGNGFMLQICSKFATNRDAVYIYIYIYRERESLRVCVCECPTDGVHVPTLDALVAKNISHQGRHIHRSPSHTAPCSATSVSSAASPSSAASVASAARQRFAAPRAVTTEQRTWRLGVTPAELGG